MMRFRRPIDPVDPLEVLDRKIGWQREALGFENLWQALHWPLMALGLAIVVMASGILLPLQPQARLAVVTILAILIFISLRPVWQLRYPRRLLAMRQMEAGASIEHRQLSSAKDSLATEYSDHTATLLWEEHKRRQLAGLENVRVVPPRSRWRLFDPVALRVPMALAVVASLLLGPNSVATNLRESVRLVPTVPAVALSMDAWIKPPAYTGRPPLLLTSPVITEKLVQGLSLDIPENARFSLRITGATDPQVLFLSQTNDNSLTDFKTSIDIKSGVLSATADITRPLIIVVRDGNKELARWPINTVPDQIPTIAFVEPPSGDPKGALNLKWKATDDYGLRKVTAELELADEQDAGLGFESNGIFLYDAPELKFALRKPNGKEEIGTSHFDLAAHPWAGLMAVLNLQAYDGANQSSILVPVKFKMPERVFVRALPRALIEQRKELILFPERAGHISTLIETLSLYPKGLFEGSAPVISMGAIASRLRNVKSNDDVRFVVAELWKLAVALEDGALSDARAELQALKQELEKALRDGASKERIAELMDKMRKAMDRYLDAMRKETEKRIQEGTLKPQPNQQGKSISRDELQKMLDELEKMSKDGSKDMAQKMLEELNKLLQNLQPGGDQQQAEGQGSGELDDMMQGLGDVMRKQQRLMDQTQRQPGMGQQGQQGQDSEQGQDGEGQGSVPGEQGQDGQDPGGKGPGGKGLADRQGELKGRLDGLKGQGQGAPSELDDAGRAMEGAEQSLRQGDREEALRQQGEALEKLRKGAQKLAQQMREQGQGQAEGQAKDGEGKGGDDDPLGRPRASRNVDEGPDKDMLPTEQDQKRAREILETLRAKANERDLTDQEKAYIDRLLRGLY